MITPNNVQQHALWMLSALNADYVLSSLLVPDSPAAIRDKRVVGFHLPMRSGASSLLKLIGRQHLPFPGMPNDARFAYIGQNTEDFQTPSITLMARTYKDGVAAIKSSLHKPLVVLIDNAKTLVPSLRFDAMCEAMFDPCASYPQQIIYVA